MYKRLAARARVKVLRVKHVRLNYIS